MVPFVVLIASFALLSVLGHFGLPFSYGWWTSLRLALAGMFLLTASAHWGKRRPDLVRMVPAAFPRAEMLVTATGILEILGSVGLMIPMVARYAALGLSLLLIAVFPANVRAARRRLAIGGRPALGLLPRSLIQIAFLAATVAVIVGGRALTSSSSAPVTSSRSISPGGLKGGTQRAACTLQGSRSKETPDHYKFAPGPRSRSARMATQGTPGELLDGAAKKKEKGGGK